MIVMNDNPVLRTIHMCENELTISFEKIFIVVRNDILRKLCSMTELLLTKATQGSCLMGYLLEYHPYVLTSNDMSRCSILLLRGISDLFSTYRMNCYWWWNFDPWDWPWVRWWVRRCCILNIKEFKFCCCCE